MRAIVQRVFNASVDVAGVTVGKIDKGLIAYIGVGQADAAEDVEWLTNKLLSLRLFEDEAGKRWAMSVSSSNHLQLLLVSQFTLFSKTTKAKPDFSRAAGGDTARSLFDAVVAKCRASLHGERRVATGEFGAMMTVNQAGDGPVTIILDSKNKQDALWGIGDAEALASPAASPSPVATPAASSASSSATAPSSTTAATSAQ
jgi:D-tyrosyl-tRNA(Tyr) deacylase